MMTLKKQLETAGVDLGQTEVVLVKFFFTREETEIFDGIRQTTTQDNSWRQKRGKEHIAEAGTVPTKYRPGHVDTGVPVFQNVPDVLASLIRTGLTNNSLPLTDAHWFVKKAPNRQDKNVVVLVFQKGTESALKLDGKVGASIRALAKTVWGAGHIWSNPDKTATINLMLRKPEGVAQNAFAIKDGKITAKDIRGLQEEE
jgi:hypothetical protein